MFEICVAEVGEFGLLLFTMLICNNFISFFIVYQYEMKGQWRDKYNKKVPKVKEKIKCTDSMKPISVSTLVTVLFVSIYCCYQNFYKYYNAKLSSPGCSQYNRILKKIYFSLR